MDAPPNPPQAPTIDRELISQDLGRLAEFLAPLIQSRLELVRSFHLRFMGLTVPVGAILYPLLSGYPAQMTSDALGRVLSLSDDELGALIDLAGLELGAWRGFPPGTPDQVAAGVAAADRLVGAIDG